MNPNDIVTFSLSNFLRRKARSVLTVLGVVIGTAAVVIMLSIGIGMEKGAEEQMSQWSDLRQIDVYKNWAPGEEGYSDFVGIMDKASLESIRQVAHVKAASPQMYYSLKLVIGRKMCDIQVMGVDPSAMADFSYELADGRLLTAADIGKNSFVMTNVVPFMFSTVNNPIWWYEPVQGEEHPFAPLEQSYKMTMDWSYGQPIQDFSQPKSKLYNMDCVGILAQPAEGMWDQAMIYMDIDLLIKYRDEYQKQQEDYYNGGGGGVYYGSSSGLVSAVSVRPMPSPGGGGNEERKDIYDNFVIIVDETKNVVAVEKAIRELGFSTSSSMSYLLQMQESTKFLRTVLSAIGIISFLVAALSITNTMIMSIYERTREIGVMKVLGCRVGDIRSMFLVEAGIIGFVGGVVGVGLSYGMSALVNYVATGTGGILGLSSAGTDVSVIPLWLPFVALALAIAVGIVSGLYPAIRATRLPALEALKNE